jgi:hypothetical protein
MKLYYIEEIINNKYKLKVKGNDFKEVFSMYILLCHKYTDKKLCFSFSNDYDSNILHTFN